jgi:tetratricopeptide (TPR) repeat protein
LLHPRRLRRVTLPIALFDAASPLVPGNPTMLLDSSAAHALPIWRAEAHRFRATLLIRNGDFDTGLRLLRASLEQSPEATYQPYFTWFLGELAEGLGRAGQIAQGLEAVDEALARSERNEDCWCVAELLRIRGKLLLLQGAPGAAATAEGDNGSPFFVSATGMLSPGAVVQRTKLHGPGFDSRQQQRVQRAIGSQLS